MEAAATDGNDGADGRDAAEGTDAAETPSPKEAAEALMTQATELAKKGEYDTARTLAHKALSVDPKAEGVGDLMASITVEETGEKQLAESSAAAKKKDWATSFAAAQVGLDKATKSKAAPKLETALRIAQTQLATSARKLGDREMRRKRYKQAVAAYKGGLVYDTDNSKLKSGLTRARRKLKAEEPTAAKPDTPVKPDKKPDKKPDVNPKKKKGVAAAKELLKQAIKEKRSSNLGKAKSLLRQCLKAHGGMSLCHSELAVILYSGGQRCAAIKHMRRYLAISPGGSKAPMFKRLIEQVEPGCM
ncbi:MAG: tetratricopeptide (TPR) repeat protein [Myxococcota bacterium]